MHINDIIKMLNLQGINVDLLGFTKENIEVNLSTRPKKQLCPCCICTNCGKKFYEEYDFLTKYYQHSNSVINNILEDFKRIILDSFKNAKIIADKFHYTRLITGP